MIQEISIRPAVAFGNYLYFCQFVEPLTGELHSILSNGRFHKGEVPKGTDIKSIDFSINPRHRNFFHTFQIKDEKNMGEANAECYVKYWLKAPNVKPPVGEKNPNFSGHADLIMDNLTTAEEFNVGINVKKNKAFQKISSLDSTGETRMKKNVAYYFGVAGADKMTENKLFVTLADLSTGIVMQPENIDRFLAYQSDDFNVQLAINTRRAIEKGFVEQRAIAGKDAYFINNHPVGDSEEAVIAYLDANKDFYHQFIVEKLGDAAETAKETARKEKKEIIETEDIVGLKAAAKELFEECKKYGIKNARVGKWEITQNVEKLKSSIEEARELLSRVQKKEVIEV